MKTLISALLSLSLVSISAIAAEKPLVFTVQGMEFSLTTDKCENAFVLTVADMIGLKPEHFARLYGGTVNSIPMCWVANPNDPLHIFVIDELGNMGELMIPAKKPSGPAT